MIEVENLSFSYQNNKVLKNISFSIEKGEYLCIIGKNGSGKSTLAKLLAALIFQQEGTIKISGYDTKSQKDLLNIRKIVGIIFQNPEEQIISTTVFDEVIFALENLAIPRENIKEIAEKSLKDLNLLEYKDRLTYQLSGGEKQRLAIASILAMGTEILIFDEATSMLDPVGKKEVLKIMKDILNIIRYYYKIDYNEDDLDYDRLVTHVRFFAKRVLLMKRLVDNNDDLLELVKIKYDRAYRCVEKINDYIMNNYSYEIGNDEKLYLILHIDRVTRKY